MLHSHALTSFGCLLLKAITSAKLLTGEVTKSLRYAFKEYLNSNAIAIPSLVPL